jgi:hypothetical protein
MKPQDREVREERGIMTKRVSAVILLGACLTLTAHAEDDKTDVERMGLEGRVSSIIVRSATFKEINGDWVEEPSGQRQETRFNPRGYKTDEITTQWNGAVPRRVKSTYDESGALVERKTYSYGNLTNSWSKVVGEDGFETLNVGYNAQGDVTSRTIQWSGAEGRRLERINYNPEGEVTSRSIQRYAADGRKLSQIDYNGAGEVTTEWESEETAGGRVIRYDQSNEWRYDEETSFDLQGNITEKERTRRDITERWTYSRDSSGLIEEGRYATTADQPGRYYVLTHDRQGRLEELVHRLDDGTVLSTRRYAYYPGGDAEDVRTVTAEHYGQDGALEYTWTYDYDSRGNQSEKTYVHAQEPFSCRWSRIYDSMDRLLEEQYRDTTGSVFSTTENVYDRKGNKVTEERYGRGVAAGRRTVFEYDSESRLIDTSVYDLEGNRLSRETRSYDARGSLVETSQYNFDDSLRTRTRYQYVYDAAGNWTEQMTLNTDNAKERYDAPSSVSRRTIAYHE